MVDAQAKPHRNPNHEYEASLPCPRNTSLQSLPLQSIGTESCKIAVTLGGQLPTLDESTIDTRGGFASPCIRRLGT